MMKVVFVSLMLVCMANANPSKYIKYFRSLLVKIIGESCNGPEYNHVNLGAPIPAYTEITKGKLEVNSELTIHHDDKFLEYISNILEIYARAVKDYSTTPTSGTTMDNNPGDIPKVSNIQFDDDSCSSDIFMQSIICKTPFILLKFCPLTCEEIQKGNLENNCVIPKIFWLLKNPNAQELINDILDPNPQLAELLDVPNLDNKLLVI